MKKLSENNISRYWMSGELPNLRDDSGNEVEVICAGRKSTRPGCDFQDAVLSVNTQKVTGDIEIHVTSDLWQKHGHHNNPAYNGIILHVVMWKQGELPVRSEAGGAVPTVVLSKYVTLRELEYHDKYLQVPGCKMLNRLAANQIKNVLYAAGMERFKLKADRFLLAIKSQASEQVLYKGICRALGYSRNALSFERLSDCLPIGFILGNMKGNLTKKHAAIIGSAGLLPSQRPPGKSCILDETAQILEEEWRRMDVKTGNMNYTDWFFTPVRPGNHPVKRLAGLGYLINEYENIGLLEGLLRLIKAAPSGREAVNLEKGLLVEGNCYWTNHYDFGLYQRRGSAMIGGGRAREIAVNVILPFFFAYAQNASDKILKYQILKLYKNYAGLPDNELLRYMKSQLLSNGSEHLNACEQQGLLHIYHSFCRAKDCFECPVSICQTSGPV